jgi:PilZ domain
MNALDKAYSEKRDFIRMKISAPLNAKLSHDDGVIEGVCRDLSGGGMQVESKTVIAEGTELVVEISSDHGHNPTLHAKAKVARYQGDATKGYILGLEIVEILK